MVGNQDPAKTVGAVVSGRSKSAPRRRANRNSFPARGPFFAFGGAETVGRLAALALLLLSPTAPSPAAAQDDPPRFARDFEVDAGAALGALIAEEDTDNDKRITIQDTYVWGNGRGDKRFALKDLNGVGYDVVGTYPLSNLLQDLKRAQNVGSGRISAETVFADPVDRLVRSITRLYWDELTRRIDADHLDRALEDVKTAGEGTRYLYVPFTDPEGYAYFRQAVERRPDLNATVVRLPPLDRLTPEFIRDHLERPNRHGLLNLALRPGPQGGGGHEGAPFVVPGGRFNEMYGWDSHFIALGLIEAGRVDLARAMVDNLVYEIVHYGKILNANRTYYLTRSQPPLLTSMALAVHAALPKTAETKAWLETVLRAAIQEYHRVWTSGDRFIPELGLSRYFGQGIGPPPEVEEGAFDADLRPYAAGCGLAVAELERMYRNGTITGLGTERCDGRKIAAALDELFRHDRCVRESGHDRTYRWRWTWNGPDRCADYVAVDLNALLYKTEIDIVRILEREFGGRLSEPGGSGGEDSAAWRERAEQRKQRINRYLWSEERGLYQDYRFHAGEGEATGPHDYVNATTFYPLWAAHPDDPSTRLTSPEQARRLIESALPLLEMPGGVVASTETARGPILPERPSRQWDYPNGWPPHQMLIWQGLRNHGYGRIADRLVYRWLYAITRNAVDFNGAIAEKMDVVRRSIEVGAEYGNVGANFDYITSGFGWTNASYLVGLATLPEPLRQSLRRLVPPEWLFPTGEDGS